ncbi:21236_t:CDS:2 [Cetraspora pellucida]|uniref:21236_t:CDS:1 n=1 Tax=Cetraspora pellucida TaxID=1433469 RepID=A0A9N9CAB2_9GLOM|nr:21236_t:CDS:2 [Cetraspora pellucida]
MLTFNEYFHQKTIYPQIENAAHKKSHGYERIGYMALCSDVGVTTMVPLKPTNQASGNTL